MYKMKFFAVILVVFLCSCSGSKVEYLPYDKTRVEGEYYQAMRFFDERNYQTALKGFETIASKYSMYGVAKNAMQMEIFLNFLLEKYEMAIATAEMYIQYYPLDRDGMEYARYITILSNLKLVPDINVTSVYPGKSLDLIREFAAKHPGSKYTESVMQKYQKLSEYIAVNKVIIADRYLKTNNYIVALIEYQNAMQYAKNAENSELLKDLDHRINITKNKIITGKFHESRTQKAQ